MAGMIHTMVHTICKQRSKGDSLIYITTVTKLILKGIRVKKYDEKAEDDPVVIEKLKKLRLNVYNFMITD